MKYNEITRRYFEATPCAGMLMGEGVSRGASGDWERGTWVQFDLQVGAAITAARFLCFGCPHTIAISAWVAHNASGRSLIPALPEEVHTLSARFGLPADKMGRLLVIEDAWRAVARVAIANQR